VGAWITPSGATRWDLGVGKGFASGYGTTEFRGFVGLTWRWSFAPAGPVEPTVVWVPGEEPDRDAAPEPLEEVSWAPTQLARIRASSIEIREPVQFRFATDEVLPVSMPTLHAVADILADHPEITQVVVEGHASEEGSYPYNYDLSLRRARAVLQVLVEAGVHPQRLACRGMGEVAPTDRGTDEGSLALNRRVAFRIVEQRDPLDPVPDLGPAVVPWTGGRPTPPEGP